MDRSSLASGRVNQKHRTRTAIVDAAIRLMADGAPPTVAQAAEAALVSRTTAYRYFPTQESLLIEITQNASVDEVEALVAAPLEADGVTDRILAILRGFDGQVFAEEARYRTALRLYLDLWLDAVANGDQDPVVREGRRRRWFETALEPVRTQLPTKDQDRLVAALSLLAGAEAIVVLRDICRLEPAAGLDVIEWIARTLIKETLA
jgi:AcrR family transcriptional regulator